MVGMVDRLVEGLSFLYSFMLMVWNIMLLFSVIICICVWFLVVCVLVRMLVEVLGMIMILMLLVFLNGGNMNWV